MRLKKRRFILAIIFLLVVLYILIKLTGCIFDHQKNVILKPQTMLEEYTRFTITPSNFKKTQNLFFNIKIESTQSPELLNIDLANTAFLEDDNKNIYEPVTWQVYKRDPNKTEGKLIFNCKYNNQKKLKLVLFKWSDNSFSWNVKK